MGKHAQQLTDRIRIENSGDGSIEVAMEPIGRSHNLAPGRTVEITLVGGTFSGGNILIRMKKDHYLQIWEQEEMADDYLFEEIS